MSQFWNPNAETMPREAIRILQSERLRRTLRHAMEHSEFYRERIEAAGLDPAEFLDVEAVERLPYLRSADLVAGYPLGLCCVPRREIREVHTSPDAAPHKIVMPYTASDLRQWAHCMARCYAMAGAVKGDVVQILPSLGLVGGGFGFYHGARLADLFVLPTGGGSPESQLALARDLDTRILGASVRTALLLAQAAENMKIKLPSLEIGIFGGGPFTEAAKETLHRAFGIEVFDAYGMTGTGGLGSLGMDCPAREGVHVWEDHYYVEIVEPGGDRLLPDGTEGELVVTTLTREALPVIRYRTEERTRVLSRAPCACGRTHLRLAPVAARAVAPLDPS
jgi:phenylacetate-CoA ligase